MTLDSHLLYWLFGILIAGGFTYRLFNGSASRLEIIFVPFVLAAVFLMGLVKFEGVSDASNRQARSLEWEMQQRIAQPLPEREESAPRLSFQDRLDQDRDASRARRNQLLESNKDTE